MPKKLNPDNFDLQCTSVWSFPRRGNRATHNSKYRGNWSPDVARNLILRYSKEGDTLLDPMVGGGTTAIEAKLLNRNLFAYDINLDAVKLTKDMLNFKSDYIPKITVKKGDARKKKPSIKDESIDFVLTHPPYADIINYTNGKEKGDLSQIHNIDEFCDEIEKIAKEFYRVLKPGKYCAILIGDTRRKKMYQPISAKVLERFLNVGFKLKEDIIKVQHNCKATGFWATNSKKYNFLLIMHEHIYVFQK